LQVAINGVTRSISIQEEEVGDVTDVDPARSRIVDARGSDNLMFCIFEPVSETLVKFEFAQWLVATDSLHVTDLLNCGRLE
jgi:hypothetical protein